MVLNVEVLNLMGHINDKSHLYKLCRTELKVYTLINSQLLYSVHKSTQVHPEYTARCGLL